ncbi:MAG: hypothetical protein MI924_18270 [Chloroflexales bacterium]|nr:hypothetical protein [Chloroflexales bacterium]
MQTRGGAETRAQLKGDTVHRRCGLRYTQRDCTDRGVGQRRQSTKLCGKTPTLASICPGPNVAVWVDGSASIPALARGMGVTLSPDRAAVENLGVKSGRVFINPEQLDLLAGATIILLQSAAVEGEMDAVNDMQNNTLWQALPAIQAGRVVPLIRLGYPGLRGQQKILNDLIKIME